MSTAFAVAAVTAVLRNLLNDTLVNLKVADSIGNVNVTALPPSRVPTEGNTEENQLNLFLYQVISNQGWRNAGLPSRDAQGQRLSNPPLAIDLHYLMTAYGKEELYADVLMGHGMQLFHEVSYLARDTIRNILAGMAALPALATSELADQVEQIKICPVVFSIEEISKLWAALQTPYRATAAYSVSVVLIESKRSYKVALPVRERNLRVLPFHSPVIESVSPQIAKGGDILTIQGTNLQNNIVRVRLEDGEYNPDTLTNTQMTLLLPNTLRAGMNMLQVVHKLDFGTASEPHRGFESNIVAFMLAPTIEGVDPQNPFQVNQGAMLTLNVTPAVGHNQRVELLVGDYSIAIPSRSVTGPATTTKLDFPFPKDFPQGTYLMRIRVDGAESALTFDQVTRRYNAPEVKVL